MDRMGRGVLLPESASTASQAGLTRVRVGDCVVEVDLDRVVAPHGETSLEPKAMAVLVCLIERAGAVVSTDELIDVVWRGRPMGDNPVYRCIAQLRRALGDVPKAPAYIATVPTKGYCLIASVDRLDAKVDMPHAPEAAPSPQPMDVEPDAPSNARPPRRGRWRVAVLLFVMTALVLAALLVLTALLWHRVPRSPAATASAEPVTLAVLPMQTDARYGAGILLAQSVTDLIRHRLARLPGLLVIASNSTAHVSEGSADARTVMHRLHARVLLQGNVTRVGDRLHVHVQVIEGPTDKVLWSSGWDRPVSELALMRDEIARNVAMVLQLAPAAPVEPNSGRVINLDAYGVYMRGQRLLWAADKSGVKEALELFRRATILDPGFARGYLGLGQVLTLQAEADPGPAVDTRAKAAEAIGRALELDPTLGEAWAGKARLTADPVKAEALYRKGLALAPSDGAGYVDYAQFLFTFGRAGEAITAIERARRIDPLAPQLCLTQAFFVVVVRSDVAEHDRLVRQALAINPRMPEALYQLAHSKWEYSGQFAEAAQLVEQAIAVDPKSLRARMLARDIYLDLGDPVAAAVVLGPSPAPAETIELAQYRGDRLAAAALLKDITPANWPDIGPQAAKAQAIRDAAIETGKFAPAVSLLESVQAAHEGRMPMWYRGFALVEAHTLVLAGNVQAGQAMARATLDLVDVHAVGRTANWFSRERASAFAVLGDNEQVLQALAHSVETGRLYRWWYLAGHDPLYAHLRSNPRFQALDRLAKAHRDRQRALLASMRREGGDPVSSRAGAGVH